MKLTKERAKKPLAEGAYCSPSTGYDSGSREKTFTVACHGEWVQGKGHTASYTLHLSKTEMLLTVSEWMQALSKETAEEARRKLASSPVQP